MPQKCSNWATSVTFEAPGGRLLALLDSAVVDLERLIAALAPTDVVGRVGAEVRDLAYDARAAGAGALFFCVPGFRADGHDFARDAVANGAVALVVQRPLDRSTCPSSSSPTRARRWPSPPTSSSAGRPASSPSPGSPARPGRRRRRSCSTRCSRRPDGAPGCSGRSRRASTASAGPARARRRRRSTSSVCSARCSTRATGRCAMEATSHGSALRRLDRVRFAALVFNNLSQDHLDFHRDMEDYFDAKRRLFVGPDAPPAAVNVGDDYGRRLADELRGGERRSSPSASPRTPTCARRSSSSRRPASR